MITIHQRHRQTDRQTDRQTTCDRYTTLCTKVHHAVKTARLTATSPMSCYLSLVDSGSSGSHNKHQSFRKLDFWHVERLWRLARVKWSPLPWLLCLYRHPAIGESPREREREREIELREREWFLNGSSAIHKAIWVSINGMNIKNWKLLTKAERRMNNHGFKAR